MLASGSPRRRELLAGLGLRFEVRPADIDESVHPGEAGDTYVVRLARAKASAVARPGDVVLAADTTVDLDGDLLGKPVDDDDARRLLRLLSGRTHLVRTGVCVHRSRQDPVAEPAAAGLIAVSTPVVRCAVATTAVTFAELPGPWIDRYVATGEPLDKAGGYGMQGSASLFVARIDGSPSNVIGLPLGTVAALLAEMALDLFTFAEP